MSPIDGDALHYDLQAPTPAPHERVHGYPACRFRRAAEKHLSSHQ
jgi:hypothetical protein